MTAENVKRPDAPSAADPDPTPEPVRPQREPGNAPEGEPGNEWVTPDAERPPQRGEGTVSDPDRLTTEPLIRGEENLPRRHGGTVSNPDF